MLVTDKPTSLPARLDRTLVFILRGVCVCCLALLLVLLSANVINRYVAVTAFYWFDEVVEWLFAWMVFFGAAALWARDEHFRLEWINERIKGTPIGHLTVAALEVVSLVFVAIFFYQSLQLTILAKDWTPVFNVSRRYLYVCMPISGLIMVIYSLRTIWRELVMFKKLR